MAGVDHIAGHTWHGRKGAVENTFRYGVDYVLLDAEAKVTSPQLFARGKRGVVSLHDADHGGAPHHGRGPQWVREVLQREGIASPARIELLAQPRVFGHVFNPVSFFLCYDEGGALRVVIAEVTNTFGDRHNYLCAHNDGSPIRAADHLVAQKILHVSPFQPQSGQYRFRFDISPDHIGILIDYTRGNDAATGGVTATLTGPRRPLTNRRVLGMLLRRPFGSRRVQALIFWQAMKLKLKGARYRNRPDAPTRNVSR